MKHIGIFFILLISFTNIIALSNKSVALSKDSRRRRSSRTRGSSNKWVRLFEGLASGFTGTEELVQEIKNCFSTIGKTVSGDDKAADTASEATVNPEKTEPTSGIVAWAGWVTKGICLAKDKIVDKIKDLLKKKRRQYSRYSRMFVEKRRRAKFSWNDLKTWATEAKDWVVKKVSDAVDQIKDFATEILKVKDAIKAKIVAMWDAFKASALYQVIVKWSSCIKALQGLAAGAMALVKLGIWIAKTAATSGASLVLDIPKMLMGLFCSWPELVEAGKSFKEAWTATDVLVKYYKYGFFVGKIVAVLIDVVAGRRRRHRRHHKLI